METIINEIKEMERWVDACYERPDIKNFNTLMDLGITLGNYLRKLTLLTLSTLTAEEAASRKGTFELHDAVIVGHLVQLYKLYDQLVYFVAESKGEISQLFSRLMFETFVMMKYLIIKGRPSIDNFIRISFKSTIRQYQFLTQLESRRKLADIEKRIISKIEDRLRIVGLNAFDLSRNKDWRLDGLTFRGILEFLKNHDPDKTDWDLSYEFLYGSGSSFVHGTWYDIELNHLTYSDGQYSPKASYDEVDPRYILPQSLIPVIACTTFLRWRGTDPDNFLIDVFEKIGNLVYHLNEMDEARINRHTYGAT
jgi:hypothetical protein